MEIAQNLVEVLTKDARVKTLTKEFIYKWVSTGPEGKRKAFFDVWDIVLKNYWPETRPILYRSCARLTKRSKIASFTGKFECIRQISNRTGVLIICDTNYVLGCHKKIRETGESRNSFFPLVEVLKRGRESGDFSGSFLNEYIKEDEYIMRYNPEIMHAFRWIKT